MANLLIGKKAWYLKKSFKVFPKEDLYILLDVDMLLLKPLTNFKKQMKKYDMAGVFGEVKEEVKISGGFLAFRPTEVIRRLIEEWDKFLSSGSYYWNKDQPSLAKLYLKHMESIRFLNVPREMYLNTSLDENSVVWSAHKSRYGSKEGRYKVYLARLQRMRKEKHG